MAEEVFLCLLAISFWSDFYPKLFGPAVLRWSLRPASKLGFASALRGPPGVPCAATIFNPSNCNIKIEK